MLHHKLDWPICSLNTIIHLAFFSTLINISINMLMFLVLQKAPSVANIDTRSACHDGALTMMSPGVSSLLFTFAFQTIERQRKQCNLSKRKRLPIDRIFITVMFSYCSRGRLWSSDEWYINVPIPSPSCASPWLLSPVTAMMRERRDEFVCRDLILLNATSPVNSCQFCHCRFQAVSWLCRGGNTRSHDLSESCIYWIIPHSVVPLREVELSSLPVALKNMWLVHSPARNRVSVLAV